MQSTNRKPLQSPDVKRHSLARALSSGRQVSSPRSSTPTQSSPLRSATATMAAVTTSPPRVLTGIAKDSVLTKQADAAITELETNLQNHTDQILSKLELMSDRVTALDDLIQSLLQDDLSDPDISIKYGKGPGVQELKAEPRTAPPDTGTSLLSEESPF